MSERKRRYFQDESGGVFYATIPDTVADYENDRTMTEVQVVPLDAIVIRRDELPEVRPATEDQRASARPLVLTRRGDALHRYITNDDTVESFRAKAAMYLALAEHLREHPPVDETQVKALRDLRDEWYDLNESDTGDLFEFLVRKGVRVEQA